MEFRNRRETDLERELRARRPQARDQFVEMLGRQFAAPKRRIGFRFAPRVGLVAAATVVLAASLGVAGAVGYAKSSVQSFSDSIYHIVQPPSSKSTSTLIKSSKRLKLSLLKKGGKGDSGPTGDSGSGGTPTGDTGSGGTPTGDPGNGNGGIPTGDPGGRHDPFKEEYDHHVDICHEGHMVLVPFHLYFYLLEHGKDYRPARDCRPRR
jgi:hypothetical protein